MTTEIANALCGYFETLYDLNRNLITLCGVDVIDNSGQYEKHMADIIQDIPRLVPYVWNKSKKVYAISDKDGLIECSAELTFLRSGYEDILSMNYDFLEKAKKVRNGFEHKMHGAQLVSAGSGSGVLFDMTYELPKEQITLTAGEMLRFTRQLNELFSKIQKQVEAFAYEQGKVSLPYYRRLLRYDFRNFNKIYDSPILREIGKTLFPF